MSACSFLKRGQLKVAEKGLSAAGWWSHSRHEIKCIDFLSAFTPREFQREHRES